MQYLKNVFFLACCLGLGWCLARGYQHFRGHTADALETPHVGIGSAPRMRGVTLPLNAMASEALDHFPAEQLHATAVTLRYPTAGSAGPLLGKIVTKAHQRKLEVVLAPPAVFSSGNPYPIGLEQVAREAQEAGVDVLCVSWLNKDPDCGMWQRAAAGVRKVFKGKVVLAGTPEVLVGMESFEGFDALGAIGPVNLPQRLPHAADDVDLHAMRVTWACVLDGLESRTSKVGKSVILLNMSVPAAVGSRLPKAGEKAAGTDPELQVLMYEGLLVETRGRRAVDGLFLPWSMLENDGEAVNHFPKLVGQIESAWSSAAPVVEAVTSPVEELDPEATTEGMGG